MSGNLRHVSEIAADVLIDIARAALLQAKTPDEKIVWKLRLKEAQKARRALG